MSLKDFNLGNILKEVGGPDVDLGESRQETKETIPSLPKGKIENSIKEDEFDNPPVGTLTKRPGNKKPRLKNTKIPKKGRGESTRKKDESSDFSTVVIRKKFTRLIPLVFPNRHIKDVVDDILDEWVKRNDKIIQESFVNLKGRK